ncbi:MAG: PD-(D/E)XK nuclease family protein [Defluviitaleaceae bacterium]|nr:PD-(D/E)XK nuclease family protein [Defluviitaleaceae bacterium]
MSVQFVLGLPGSGKTKRCLDEISGRLNGGAPLYYLVPDQFSLQAEKLLTEFGQTGALLGAQAISFNRLAHQLLSKLGIPKGRRADEIGRNMLLRKCLAECSGGLSFYKLAADKQGFVDQLAKMITEFNRYGVTEEKLRLASRAAPEGLALKLGDLAAILGAYRAQVSGKYVLADDMLDALYERLSDENILSGSFFWVDGFNGFTPQERRVLGAIMQAAKRTVFTLTMRQGKDGPDYLCESANETYDRMRGLAAALGVSVEPDVWLRRDYRHIQNPELEFLTAHFDPSLVSGRRYQSAEKIKSVEIVRAPDRYAEVFDAARRVIELVSDGGCRYRDVAILCGDRQAYEKTIKNVFARLKIPLFVDTKAKALAHPLTELIRAALEICAKNWQAESVFRLLKTRLTPFDPDEIDKLENFVLKRGISGYKFKHQFQDYKRAGAGATVSDETAGAEATRKALTLVLAPLTESPAAGAVKNYCLRVYETLGLLQATNKLDEMRDEREKARDYETAMAHRQIWPKIGEVFEKLVEILGEEETTLKEFSKILDAGLAQADLGLIPPTTDQVFLGDVARSRFPEINALLVLGANEGMLPKPGEPTGLFNDYERESLRQSGMDLAPDAARLAGDDAFSLYIALCRPKKMLVVSWPAFEPDGRELKPDRLISRLLDMFPGLRETRAAAIDEFAPAGRADFGAGPVLGAGSGLALRQNVSPLLPETVSRLYGPVVATSASRLEKYSECPFAYYLSYNLNAREREIYQVRPADLGVVFHDVLALFSDRLKREGLGWGEIRGDRIASLTDECVEAVVPREAALRGTARNANVLRKVKRICKTSVWALCEHAKRGTFSQAGAEYEIKFGQPATSLEIFLDGERKLVLAGRIDRVDILVAEGGVGYVKVIDYKSGKKRFSISDVLLGVQLQLMLYMNALLKNAAELFGDAKIVARPGGVFYFHFDDPVLRAAGDPDKELREEMLLKCFRMSGIAVDEKDALAGMDGGASGGAWESPVIQVAYNKDGELGKSSAVMDLDSFIGLGEAAAAKAKEIGRAMTSGIIDPGPTKKGSSGACEYCQYCAICSQYG